MNIEHTKIAHYILDITKTTLNTHTRNGGRWESALLENGEFIDIDKVREIEYKRTIKKEVSRELGLMIYYFLKDRYGLKFIRDGLNKPDGNLTVHNLHDNLLKDIHKCFLKEHKEAFRESEYNYLKTLEKFEDVQAQEYK
jgi:hypothetical protein